MLQNPTNDLPQLQPPTYSPSRIKQIIRVIRVSIFCFIFSLPIVICGASSSGQAFQHPTPPTDHRKAYQNYILNPAWKNFARTVPEVDANDRGYVGLNKDRINYPELQAVGSAFVIRGILQGREDWTMKGWRILDAAMIDMDSEGKLIGASDLVHSSSFFLSSYSEALLAEPPAATPKRVKNFLKAVAYLNGNKQQEEGLAMCRRFTHRCFLWALMYEGAEAFEPGAGYETRARQFMALGLSDQRRDGVLPENNGFDALYQSIANDALIKVTAIQGDPALRAKLTQAARLSLNMMASRVADNGRLDTSGSVRLRQEKTRDGRPKQISPWQIAFPFVGAAILFQEPVYQAVANRVMRCDVNCQNSEGR